MKLNVTSEIPDDVRECEKGAGQCATETEYGAGMQLFDRNWDFFVIKKDEVTGKLRSFIECCGRLSGITPQE
jgi:hypothetical protein